MSNTVQAFYDEQFGAQSAQPSGGTRSLYDLESGVNASSALMSIAAGDMRAKDLQRAAGDQLVLAESEETAALERANRITRRQMEVSAGVRAAFAASGVDLGSGTVKQLDKENRRNATSARVKTLNAGARRAGQRRRAARVLAKKAAETFGLSLVGGVVSAGTSIMTGGGR